MRWLTTLTLAPIAALGLSAPLAAYDLPADATEMETALYGVLEKHCSRCHQDGALKEGLAGAKSGFGHVLDLRRLAEDPDYVRPGDPGASKLYNVIGPYSFPSMPDDCLDDACYPTNDDAKIIEDWIVELANQEPEPRPFVSFETLHEAAYADLQTVPTNRWDRIRYISIRNMHNDQTISDENLMGYRAGVVKSINALSWNPVPYSFVPVDEHEVLMRIFLPDLNWDHQKWGLLESRYPYGLTGETDANLRQLTHATHAKVPIIRGDWFTSHATAAPLYYDMLGLPDTVAGLEHLLNLDINANILNEQVIRGGFQDSGVSTNNRMIERHPLNTGFFWTSYDFAGSKGRQSFFEYPLGPKEVYGPELAFEHDGGESIFTLPNGFHAYYLNTADGARLDVGPTDIVRDDDYAEGTGEVVNGISCISCHSKGMRFRDDKVHDSAMGNLAFSAEARQIIGAIYPGKDVVNDQLTADEAQFAAALAAAGIDVAQQAGGLEPVRGTFVYHVDGYIDYARAASELGLTEDEFRERANFAGFELAGLIARLDQSPIARDEWEAVYPVMLDRVTDYEPYYPEYRAADYDEGLSYSVKKVVDDFTPPTVDYKDVPTPAAYKGRHDPGLTIYTEKPVYKLGEGLRIYVEPRHDCRLTLINIDSAGKSCVLYPHPSIEDVVISGGSQYVFPPRGSLTTGEVGTETLLAICNGSGEALGWATRDTHLTSCDAGQRYEPDKPITAHDVYETLILDLDAPSKTTASGADYDALSTHNPDITQSRFSFEVTP